MLKVFSRMEIDKIFWKHVFGVILYAEFKGCGHEAPIANAKPLALFPLNKGKDHLKMFKLKLS